MRRLLVALAVVVLTLLTQVGGLALLVGLALARKSRRRVVRFLAPLGVYAGLTIVVVPLVARLFGRVPLPVFATQDEPVSPLNLLTCALNRHYARPPVRDLLVRTARASGEELHYLDAGFPFRGVPLLPHLSHGDGRKVDLAFAYVDRDGRPVDARAHLFLGYGATEPPRPGEIDQPALCARAGHRAYGLFADLPSMHDGITADASRTRDLVRRLALDPVTERVFLEPHLRTRWGLDGLPAIAFHGCHAVRHDDHVHVQVR